MYTLTIHPKTRKSTISRFFDRIIGSLWRSHDAAKYETAKNVFEELVDRTPVDTGRARAGWHAYTGPAGIPPILDYKRLPPNSYGPPTFDAPRRIRKTDEYTISNNVYYIDYLNMGHSQQAPAGFIEQAVAAGIARSGRLAEAEFK